HARMLWQSVVVALAAVLLLTAERHPAVAAAAAVPANSYPLYPYYAITWNNTSYNVTWAHTQSAFGNQTTPYPYPVIQSQGQVIPYPYPNFDYPCTNNVSGTWYCGTCSLGGRGRGNFGGCPKPANSSTAATPAKRRRDVVLDFPDPKPSDDFVVSGLYGDKMPKINAPGVVTGVFRYIRPPAGGVAADRVTSAAAAAASGPRNRPNLKAGQNSAGIGAAALTPNRRRDFAADQKSAPFSANLNPAAGLRAPDVFGGIHQSSGANATATTLTRRNTRSCSMIVSGFVDGVFTLDGGGNVTGTCYDYSDGTELQWMCLQTIATYDAAGVYIDMRPQNVSCYGFASLTMCTRQ
ncbi:hypothetical protein HDU87_000476, partial [Geranomyces variabilis]